MTFPKLFTVGWHACTEDVILNDYNDLTAIYTPAANVAGTQIQVYGWSTPSSTEPGIAGHDRVIVDMQLLVDRDFPAGPYDLIDIPNDGQYQVIGQLEDYDQGPFGFTPGKVVNLQKVSG